MLAPTREPRLLVAQATMPPSGDELPRHQLLGERLKAAGSAVGGFIDRRYFLVGVVAAVALAAGFPSVGRRGGPLRPEITVVWGATCGIFLLAGLGLPTSDLARAAANFRLHGLIQAINLCLIPLGTLAVCTPLVQMGLLAPVLRDGMLVMAALPTTVNMCVALTRSSAGDEALAIFNAVLGNILGVLLTPALLLTLVGTSGALSVVETLQKLSTKVVLPLVIGQLLRPALNKSGVLTRRKKLLSRTSESLLLYVVFSTFCDTFLRGFGLPPSTLASLSALVVGTHVAFLAVAWQIGGMLGLQPKQRVTVTLTSTQKTLALGLPLLRVVFAGRPDLGLLCTPLLIQHPLQLLIGSLLSPRLKQYALQDEGGGQKVS